MTPCPACGVLRKEGGRMCRDAAQACTSPEDLAVWVAINGPLSEAFVELAERGDEVHDAMTGISSEMIAAAKAATVGEVSEKCEGTDVELPGPYPYRCICGEIWTPGQDSLPEGHMIAPTSRRLEGECWLVHPTDADAFVGLDAAYFAAGTYPLTRSRCGRGAKEGVDVSIHGIAPVCAGCFIKAHPPVCIHCGRSDETGLGLSEDGNGNKVCIQCFTKPKPPPPEAIVAWEDFRRKHDLSKGESYSVTYSAATGKLTVTSGEKVKADVSSAVLGFVDGMKVPLKDYSTPRAPSPWTSPGEVLADTYAPEIVHDVVAPQGALVIAELPPDPADEAEKQLREEIESKKLTQGELRQRHDELRKEFEAAHSAEDEAWERLRRIEFDLTILERVVKLP